MVGQPPSVPSPHCWGFEITLRHTTLGRTPPEEWSARRRDPYLTTHNVHKRQAPIPRRDSNPQCQQSSGRKSTPDNVRQLINMTLLPLPRDRKAYLIFLLKTWQHFECLVKDKVISLCQVTEYVISFVIKTWWHLQCHVKGKVTDYVTETYLHFQCHVAGSSVSF